MFRKILFFIFLISVIISILYFIGNQNVKDYVNNLVINFVNKAKDLIAKKSFALTKAKKLIDEALLEGRDLSNGPCLAERIIFDWSVDIVHSPKTQEDYLISNQCQSYLHGYTNHLIEMDEWGNVISVK